MNHVRLGILTPVWKRPDLARLSLIHTRKSLESAGADVLGVVVGSEGDDSASLATDVGYEYVEHPNGKLGAKCLAATPLLKEMDLDAILINGSDNFLSREYCKFLVDQVDKGIDAISHRSCYFYELGSDRAYYGRPFACGVGTVISTKHLNSIRWNYCDPELSAQLDLSIKRRAWQTAPRWYVIHECKDRFAILDVKSDTNMNSIRRMRKLTGMKPLKSKPTLDRLFPGLRSKLDKLVTKQCK